MALFDEILFDTDVIVAGGATGGPEYANTVIRNPATGVYKVNIDRYDFQQVWNISTDLLTPELLEYFMRFWGGGFGSGYGFRVVIVSDFYMVDQVIGTGNGTQTVFPLLKTYKRPGANHQYVRRIIKPATNTNVVGGVTLYEPDGVTVRTFPTDRGEGVGVPAFTVELNGTPTSAYQINNTTGVITMNAAPANGVVVTVSCEFDTAMRFMMNSFTLKPDISSDISGITLCEILPAELSIV